MNKNKLFSTTRIAGASVLALTLSICSNSAFAMKDKKDAVYAAKLSGASSIPSVYTPAYGTFKAIPDKFGKYIYFEMYYSSLLGDAKSAHIHFGQKFATSGGVIATLCGGDYTPACPTYSGWVKGKITYKDIVGPKGQGIYPGDIKSAIKVLKKGLTYINVHTSKFPKGELRGQVLPADK
ncbi:MAG TPA: CHRD domain-containing protein [Gammaproteobacteria bacterium]|nr:CHRD domain-containing protein [Gammaproteobacteria bacterium]